MVLFCVSNFCSTALDNEQMWAIDHMSESFKMILVLFSSRKREKMQMLLVSIKLQVDMKGTFEKLQKIKCKLYAFIYS